MTLEIDQIRTYFRNELENENFTTDRNGGKTIELIGASFYADEPAIFGTPNEEYIQAELDWYDSQSTNINDIYVDRDPPQAWQMTGNRHGEINSNYGYLIHSKGNGNQYQNVLDELCKNPDSRRASMVYQRPSIWTDYNENGKNDFICTNSVTYYIRDGKLDCVVQMRSNDVIFGYRNDYAWQKAVLDRLAADLNKCTYVKPGQIIWQVQNLHVYDRHFDLVKL
jgi:thymidylate synthase